ncbi:MAG: hypothetical protein GX465_19520 [Acidobacteria bacterium]|nr:hypothetical protein [Acidobacteriota bacterium]
MDDDVLERAKEICNSHMRIHIVTSTMEELIAETERLRSEREVWIKHCQENSQQAAHIQELEDALVEERTWRNFYKYNTRTESYADSGYSLVKYSMFSEAHKQLQAEGKIGGGDKE